MNPITAHIDEPAGVERRAWPVTAGLPFAPGELRDAGRVRLRDGDGRVLPTAATPLAQWPDGSLRWVLLDAQVDVPARARSDLQLDLDGDLAEPETPLKVEVRNDAIDVLTGPLALRVATTGPRLLRAASRGRQEFLRPDDETPDLTAWGPEAQPYPSVVEAVRVETHNALRVVIHARGSCARGSCAAGNDRLLGWEARLTCYAGHPFVRLDVTVVHDEATRPEVRLRRLVLGWPLSTRAPCRVVPGSFEGNWQFTPAVDLRAGDAVQLTQWNVERHTLAHGPGAGQRLERRSNALGWLHVADAGAGVTVKLRRPWQSYPKTLGYADGRLRLELYPDLADFAPPRAEPGRRWTEIDDPTGIYHDTPLRLPQGMARSHELYLRFGAPRVEGAHVDRFALAAEMPLLLQLPSSRWAETGVFGPFPAFSDRRWPLELKLRSFARAPNGRGILNDGDQVRLETGADGRPRTRTTENLAYELPRSLLRQYLRAGDQRLFWEGEAAVRHLMDVDTVHFQSERPEWVGGPYFEWSQNHHYADTDETQLTGPHTSHTWLGSLLDYHFLTGCPRARQVAQMCADYCRRAAPYAWKESLTAEVAAGDGAEWPYSTRRVGWALTAMGTWCEVFPEDRFLPAMESLVDLLEVWQDDEGRWRDQIGTHNRGATPFMISGVLQGLQLYHRITGDRRARRLAIDGARWLARHGRTREGIFFYKEAPISDNPHGSTVMLLAPLAWVYEETGDAEVLDAGHRLFRWLVDDNGAATYMLKDLFAFMPLLERLGLLDVYEPPQADAAAPGA